MNIVLAGGPDSNKAEVALLVAKQVPSLVISGIPERPIEATLGYLADWKTELFVAAYRAHRLRSEIPIIHCTSLLDSVAYITMRLAGMIVRDTMPDDEVARWELTLTVVATLVRDSFDADFVYYFPPETTEMESFNEGVVAFYPSVLDSLDQEYVTLEGNQNERAESIVLAIQNASLSI